jgi:hypothetical protein
LVTFSEQKRLSGLNKGGRPKTGSDKEPVSVPTLLPGKIRSTIAIDRTTVVRPIALDDHPNADAGIVDVPGHGPLVDALSGELRHAGIEAWAGQRGKSFYRLGLEPTRATANRDVDIR